MPLHAPSSDGARGGGGGAVEDVVLEYAEQVVVKALGNLAVDLAVSQPARREEPVGARGAYPCPAYPCPAYPCRRIPQRQRQRSAIRK